MANRNATAHGGPWPAERAARDRVSGSAQPSTAADSRPWACRPTASNPTRRARRRPAGGVRKKLPNALPSWTS